MRTRIEELVVELGFPSYPQRHTCDGEDRSPGVRISGLDQPYLAIILDDPDAPGGTFTHWLIWNVPATSTVPEGVSLKDRPPELPGAVQGVNSGGGLGYMGPCPPKGKPHRYFLKVYGLDAPLELEPGATKTTLEKALNDRARQYGEAMATYQRP